MKAKMLGSFSCIDGHQDLVPSASKPRQVFALLLLRQGYVQPVQTLFEEIWGDHEPASASTTLQTYVLQIRRMLAMSSVGKAAGICPKSILKTQANGYLMLRGKIDTDVEEFWNLQRLGMHAYGEMNWSKARKLLEDALGLWGGPVLVDVPAGGVLRLEILRLNAARGEAERARIECAIHAGETASVLTDLHLLVAQSPLDESLSGLLMHALYKTVGTYSALEEFKRLRTALVSEIGLEPGPVICGVRQSILTGQFS